MMKTNYWKALGSALLCGTTLLGATDVVRAQDPAAGGTGSHWERLDRQDAELLRDLNAAGAAAPKGSRGVTEGGSPAAAEAPAAVQQTAGEAPPAPAAAPPAAAGAAKTPADAAAKKPDEGSAKKDDAAAKKADEAAKKDAPATDLLVVGRDLGLNARWRNGLFLETKDEAFKVHVGGRTQVDGAWMTADNDVQFGRGGTGEVFDGVNFRRARLEVDGTFYEVVDFFAEYEFLGNTFNTDPTLPANVRNIVNTPGPTDLWATLTHIPYIGNFRIGNMKPPIGFEHITSSRWLNFMERSFAFDAFIGGTNNGFIPGMQIFNWTENERMTWALGVFKNNQTVLGWNVGDGEYDVTGRVTYLAYYADEGRRLIHLGLGASHRDLDEDQARLRARTLLRNGPFTLQTRLADFTVGGNSQDVVVPEFAAVWGPWSMEAEFFANWISNVSFPAGTPPPRGTIFTPAADVQILYFLTGEHRPYLKHGGSGAAFDRVVPFRNFYFVPGECRHLFSSGAWQVGARFSYIDLTPDAIIAQGAAGSGAIPATLYDMTLGLNWFLNPNMKLQWNYSLTFRNAPGDTSDGTVQGFGTRFAMDF